MATPAPSALRTTLRQDALVAAGVAVLLVVGSVVSWRDDVWVALPYLGRSLTLRPPAMGLLLAESIPLVFRRLAPWPVLFLCLAASLGLQAIHEPTPLPLGVLVAVYTVVVRQRPLVSVSVAAAYVGLLALGVVTGAWPVNDDLFYDYLIALVATVMLGYGIALGRVRALMAERRAVEVARDHDIRTQVAVAQEQARIAREVHDIVAHDVSVIVAQAAAARRVMPEELPPATTLRSIETVGRDALDGLRRLMTLVRSDGGDLRHPQPTLDGLPALVEQVRGAGLPVDLVVHGEPRRLPGTVETNAYRIVQEALTNALKHAGPSRAHVVLDYRPDELHLEVRDDGGGTTAVPVADGRSASAGGFGLVGMRQRAALLDGRVDAGPGEAGGFRVTALLPLPQG